MIGLIFAFLGQVTAQCLLVGPAGTVTVVGLRDFGSDGAIVTPVEVQPWPFSAAEVRLPVPSDGYSRATDLARNFEIVYNTRGEKNSDNLIVWKISPDGARLPLLAGICRPVNNGDDAFADSVMKASKDNQVDLSKLEKFGFRESMTCQAVLPSGKIAQFAWELVPHTNDVIGYFDNDLLWSESPRRFKFMRLPRSDPDYVTRYQLIENPRPGDDKSINFFESFELGRESSALFSFFDFRPNSETSLLQFEGICADFVIKKAG